MTIKEAIERLNTLAEVTGSMESEVLISVGKPVSGDVLEIYEDIIFEVAWVTPEGDSFFSYKEDNTTQVVVAH